MINATDFYDEESYRAALEERVATPAEAMQEYAVNVGGYDRFKDRQWILTDYDVWVRNPHYCGPEQCHPEEEPEEFDARMARAARPVPVIELGEDEIPF